MKHTNTYKVTAIFFKRNAVKMPSDYREFEFDICNSIYVFLNTQKQNYSHYTNAIFEPVFSLFRNRSKPVFSCVFDLFLPYNSMENNELSAFLGVKNRGLILFKNTITR